MSKFVFGQKVINTMASECNPYRTGYFVKEFVRHGRLNPGRTIELTDGKGDFWTVQPSGPETVIPAPPTT